MSEEANKQKAPDEMSRVELIAFLRDVGLADRMLEAIADGFLLGDVQQRITNAVIDTGMAMAKLSVVEAKEIKAFLDAQRREMDENAAAIASLEAKRAAKKAEKTP